MQSDEEKKLRHRESQKRYRLNHPEKVKEIEDRYKHSHPELVLKIRKKQYAKKRFDASGNFVKWKDRFAPEVYAKKNKLTKKYISENRKTINKYVGACDCSKCGKRGGKHFITHYNVLTNKKYKTHTVINHNGYTCYIGVGEL